MELTGGPTPHVLDPGLPHQPATVCEDSGLRVAVCSTVAHREQSWPLSWSPNTLPSPTNHLTAICKSSLTSLLSSASSGTTELTENLFRSLWTGASRTTSSSTPGRPKSWWWISAGTEKGTDTEIETSYKYLGVHLNKKLDWADHTAATYKKGQSRVHLLRRLRFFGLHVDLLTFFILWSSLLEQQHLSSRQEATG